MNIEKLNTKDKYIILKAIETITKDLYDEDKTLFTNNINNNGTYTSSYGMLFLRNNKSKTIEDIITEKQKKIKELQNEIDLLKMIEPNKIHKESTQTLNCKLSQLSKDIAKELIKDLIKELDFKRLTKHYNKL